MASPSPHALRARIERLAGDVATADAEVAALEGRLAAAKTSAAGLRRTKKETELELGRAVDRATDRLIEAARRGDLGAARAALEAGADTHRPTPVVEGWDAEGYDEAVDEAMLSPLGWAATRGNREMAALLLDEGGADPNQARTADGATALMEGAYRGKLEVVRLLLDRAADPNRATTDDGSTTLMCAASGGHLEVAQLLLLFGADPDVQDDYGETAHAAALNNWHPGVAGCLGAVAGWPAFKIATACRLHADARRMLHRGTVDPSDCSLAELLAVGGTPANALWPGSPGPCDATAALARAAMSSW